MVRPKRIPYRLPSRSVVHSSLVKKPHKFHPGTVALREIRTLQNRTDWLIQHAPFCRLIREIADDIISPDCLLRFEKEALAALHESAEAYLINIFKVANSLTVLAKKQTIEVKHIKVAVDL